MARRIAEVRTLKVGYAVMIDGEPCKIVSYTTSKPGKHGAAKARVEAMGIFGGQRRGFILPVDAKIEIPVVERKAGQFLAAMGDAIQIMDLGDYSTFEVPKPDIPGLTQGAEIEYLEFEGRRLIERAKSA
jgi:translation initiation factor 5A